MREQFEKLPEIANVLENEDTEWSDRTRRYVGYDADFANGAWYAFQEQQKKVDAIKKMIVSLRSEFDLWSDDTESSDAIESQIENLEELLK